ncbi:hypothetical protein MtrunA17_Chr3g0085571 [Medicago truncatula]|uniref:Uncharacterized protein n=1 Tax=Medicago truncatula TaxID=3880 RepID=A0A396IJV5_MEDTR|nr:hypothetical protein MtrunA17_Chr3g0085571 [Medicago truncatula]
MKQLPAPPTHYFLHHLHFQPHFNPKIHFFYNQFLIQNHSSIKHRRYQHTIDVKKQVLCILFESFFGCFRGIYVSYVEPCHGNPRQLTAEGNFGCLVPKKTSVARYRGTLGENFHHEKMAATAKFSKKIFFLMVKNAKDFSGETKENFVENSGDVKPPNFEAKVNIDEASVHVEASKYVGGSGVLPLQPHEVDTAKFFSDDVKSKNRDELLEWVRR